MDITHFRVPKFVNRKDEVTLECDFRMSEPHETLHSVKWYRIDHSGSMEDFFTYSPAKNPPVKTYPRTGIKVDVSYLVLIRQWIVKHLCLWLHFRTCDVHAEVRSEGWSLA